NRTFTALRPPDFESGASASSANPAQFSSVPQTRVSVPGLAGFARQGSTSDSIYHMTQTAVALTANLDHQLQEATELRTLAYAIIVAEHRREFTRAQRLALLVFYRSLQTHEAIEILMRRQLVEDGRALLRVLVEHVVNSAYMLVIGDDETATDFIKFPAYW